MLQRQLGITRWKSHQYAGRYVAFDITHLARNLYEWIQDLILNVLLSSCVIIDEDWIDWFAGEAQTECQEE